MHVSMNKPTLALKIAFVLAMMTLAGAAVSATRAADIEARAHPNGAVGAAPFSTIPNLSASDFADSSGINSVSASVVTGSLHPVSGPFSKLFDGQWPATWDSPGDTVFDLQRLGVNLNGSVDLSQINTYSRHVTSRTPQSYTLYGSNAILAPDGTGTPGDLITNGWTQIDSVDTTGASPPNGTNTALAGIAGASANGSLGQFRHLLFDLSTSGSGGAFAGTFYGELDIQGTVQSGAKATFESRTHNPPGNVGTGAIVGSPFTRITNLSNTDFADAVLREIFDTGLDPCNLQLELTETILMNDVKETIATLNKLKKAGISLAMDDFGTGYSSLSYLNRLPVDTLKIDRLFVMDLETNRENAAICAAIIAMAHALDLKVVAEGVETEGQKNYLRNQRCDQIQGFLISKPLPPETLANAFLSNAKNPALIRNT